MPHIFKKMSTHYNKKHFQNYTFYLLFPCSHSWPMHASQSQTHVAPPQYYAALRKKIPQSHKNCCLISRGSLCFILPLCTKYSAWVPFLVFVDGVAGLLSVQYPSRDFQIIAIPPPPSSSLARCFADKTAAWFTV